MVTLNQRNRYKGVYIDELPHCFYTDASLVGKEYENLVGWVFSGVGEEIELVSTGPCELTSAGA
jgi:hypothetical protein